MSNDVKGTHPEMEAVAQKVIESSEQLAKTLPVLGNVLFLYMQSNVHKHFFVSDLEARTLPALMRKQCKLYIQSNAAALPMAFVSWAFLSEQAEEAFVATQKIAPKDWDSGDNLWIVDVLTPFGGTSKVFQELNEKIFKGREINILYPDKSGKTTKRSLQEIIQSGTSEPEGSKSIN